VRVLHGVLGELHDRLRESLAIGLQASDAVGVELPVVRRERPGLREQLLGERVEVDVGGLDEVGLLGLASSSRSSTKRDMRSELVADELDRLAALHGIVAEQLEVRGCS